MALVLIVATGVATIAFARASMLARDGDYRQRITNITELLSSSGFPLTNSVLDQMERLSGAEFVVVAEPTGEVIARSSGAPAWPQKTDNLSRSDDPLGNLLTVGDGQYYHSWTRQRQVPAGGGDSAGARQIHVLLSRERYRETWWQVLRPALTGIGITLPLVLVAGLALANNVTRPIKKLQQRLLAIAGGDRTPVPQSSKDDEIADLGNSVNRMLIDLERHDEQLRQNERLETLVQMGSGLAHNLRNAVAGCRIAVELAGASNEHNEPCGEELAVARRQLARMSHYVDRFLAIARGEERPEAPDLIPPSCEAKTVLLATLPLVEPSARHLGVRFEVSTPDHPVEVNLSPEEVEQILTNLVSNAIQAASEAAAARGKGAEQPFVRLSLTGGAGEETLLEVIDNGPGPPLSIQDTLFQPFVTASKGGTGLGLFLVAEIARRRGGLLDWRRENGHTRFSFRFANKG